MPFKKHATQWQIQSPGTGTISHTVTIADNNHRLDGTVYVAKDLQHLKNITPDASGARLDYSHQPSNLNVGVGADHVRGGGTNVNASGTWNIVNTPASNVGLTGHYGKQSHRKPDFGVSMGGRINF